jgi:hypothetical protein
LGIKEYYEEAVACGSSAKAWCERSVLEGKNSPLVTHDLKGLDERIAAGGPVPKRGSGGEPIVEFCAHAPNVITDDDGAWVVSSTDYPHRGISVAPLEWKTSGRQLSESTS